MFTVNIEPLIPTRAKRFPIIVTLNIMDHKQKLEELNKESLKHIEEYIKTKSGLKKEHHEKLHTAKEEWQVAWAKFMETLLVLERLEL
jgi:hypothetical protein